MFLLNPSVVCCNPAQVEAVAIDMCRNVAGDVSICEKDSTPAFNCVGTVCHSTRGRGVSAHPLRILGHKTQNIVLVETPFVNIFRWERWVALDENLVGITTR